MNLHLEFEKESDGRWIAEIVELPGVLAYGKTRTKAREAALALALRVLADKIEHGEFTVNGRSTKTLKHLSFVESA